MDERHKAAQNARKRGDRIIAIFNLDGVGGKPAAEKAAGKLTNVTAYTKAEGAWLAELMKRSTNDSRWA